MRRFVLIRVLQSLVALWIITIIVLGLSHMTGSPIDALLPDDASPRQIEDLSRHWGLDRPLNEQYLTFLGNAVQGDFGASLKWRGQTTMEVALYRLPATLELAVVYLVLNFLVDALYTYVAPRIRYR